MNLSRTIKICRQAKGLKQRELAEKAGISISYLSLLEKGKRDPNISILEAIAKALNIPFALLIFIASEKNDLPELDKNLTEQLMQLTFNLISHDK